MDTTGHVWHQNPRHSHDTHSGTRQLLGTARAMTFGRRARGARGGAAPLCTAVDMEAAIDTVCVSCTSETNGMPMALRNDSTPNS